MNRIAFCLSLFSVVAVIHAQDGFPISTDRPSFSDGTGIIPKGRWQIETGYTFTKVDRAEFQSIGEVLLRLPLSEQLELRLLNFGFGRANAAGGGTSGLLDPSLGIKYRFQTGVAGKSPDLALALATHMAASGKVSLSTLKDQLGHSQISLTVNTYGHAVPSALKDLADLVGEVYGQKAKPAR